MKEETELEYLERMLEELPKYPTPFLSHAIAYVNLRIMHLKKGDGRMKDFILAINNLKIDIINNSDNLNSYELGNIKRHARDLYESLVWLQYAKEEVEG
nr:MAG TPA: hypothetical protein [Caudoviricetes sp.]